MTRKRKADDVIKALVERRARNECAAERLRREIADLERDNALIAAERARRVAYEFDPLGR